MPICFVSCKLHTFVYGEMFLRKLSVLVQLHELHKLYGMTWTKLKDTWMQTLIETRQRVLAKKHSDRNDFMIMRLFYEVSRRIVQ